MLRLRSIALEFPGLLHMINDHDRAFRNPLDKYDMVLHNVRRGFTSTTTWFHTESQSTTLIIVYKNTCSLASVLDMSLRTRTFSQNTKGRHNSDRAFSVVAVWARSV